MEHIIFSHSHKLILENIVKAENCFLYDSNHNRYIDLESGDWCTSLGHSHPQINRVIIDQVNRITHIGFCYADPIIEESAYEILKTLEIKNGKCIFLSSGSDAVQFGTQVIQSISEKPLLLTMSDTFLASYGTAAVKPDNEWFQFDWMKCANCETIDSCNPSCPRLAEIPYDVIAGFVFEPGSSSGLVRFPPLTLVQNIAIKTKENRGVLMVNEVTTGVGRTGKWFGFQHYDLKPDIVALGKGIGNGFPVSVTAMTQKIHERLKNVKSFKFGHSHQNDPLGAVVAREVVKIVNEEKLIERSHRLGTRFLVNLNQLWQHHPIIKDIRGRGLMIAIEFQDTGEKFIASSIQEQLLQSGFIVANRPGLNALRIDPPITTPEEELDNFIHCLDGILAQYSV